MQIAVIGSGAERTAPAEEVGRLLARPVVVLGPGPGGEGEGIAHAETAAEAVALALGLVGAR